MKPKPLSINNPIKHVYSSRPFLVMCFAPPSVLVDIDKADVPRSNIYAQWMLSTN